MMPAKICVLGHFGDGRELLDGQTVKTRVLTEELQRQCGESQVFRIDTYGGWKNLLKAPAQVLRALRAGRNVLILPAQNGLRIYAPLLACLRGLYPQRTLHYVVIGGWLPAFLEKRKLLSFFLKRFEGIYVETASMKNALEKQGFCNVVLMPNCKKLRVLRPEELHCVERSPYKLCTFSRVMKEKGIEDAVIAVTEANRLLGCEAYTLDIFGQIDKKQTAWFDRLRETFPPCVRYGGIVPFDQSVFVLKDYFALLFPTYYEGEGFAGTVLDAFSAGVPVIASCWRYNEEIVKSGYVGTLVRANDPKALTDCLLQIWNDPASWNKMKRNCLDEAARYTPAAVLQTLLNCIS